jgi:hypothetical protein
VTTRWPRLRRVGANQQDAYGRAAGQAAEMLPFAAAPFTAGTSLPAVLPSWVAGVAGILMREGTKAAIGSGDPADAQRTCHTLGADAVTGWLGEAAAEDSRVLKEAVPVSYCVPPLYEMGRTRFSGCGTTRETRRPREQDC